MKNLARRSAPFVAVAVLGALLLVAAASGHGNGKASSSASIKACALLPDTKSSTRYTLFDAPYLKAAFKKAGVPAQVLNALGDSQKQKSQAQQCLAQGAKVILLDQLDAGLGQRDHEPRRQAGREGDRLRPPRRRQQGRLLRLASTTSGSGSCRARASSPR